MSGVVPDGSREGMIGFLGKEDCGCEADIDFQVHDISFRQGGGEENLVSNGSFDKWLEDWGITETCIALPWKDVPTGDATLQIWMPEDVEGGIYSASFGLVEGLEYELRFRARIAPGAFAYGDLIFLGEGDEVLLVEDLVMEPAVLTLETETVANGYYSLILDGLPEGNIHLTVSAQRTAISLPASVELDFQYPPPDAVISQPEIPEHLIGVREVDGVGEFYHRQTNERFVPRGVNYVWMPGNGRQTLDLFKPDEYDTNRVHEDFKTLASMGHNTVRLIYDLCFYPEGCMGDYAPDPDHVGIDPTDLDNLVDLMNVAKEQGLFLLLASNELPPNSGYATIADQGAVDGQFDYYSNTYFLTNWGILAHEVYWRDLLEGLIERDAPFDIVLGWQLNNEHWYMRNRPPFSLTSGLVTTANGETYDMADPSDKRRMAVEGTVYYVQRLRSVITSYDPSALIAIGFFVPNHPNYTDVGSRLPFIDWAYVETADLFAADPPVDFYDLHAYPHDLSMEQFAENYGILGYERKPIIMGEYGIFYYDVGLTAAGAAAEQWMIESCDYGFDGWLYWQYYSSPGDFVDTTWDFADYDEYLMRYLAPSRWPEVCPSSE